MPRKNIAYFVVVLFVTAVYFAQVEGRLSITWAIILNLIVIIGAYFYVNEGK